MKQVTPKKVKLVKNTFLCMIHLEYVLKPTYDREENHQNHKLQVYLIVSAHPLVAIHFT